MPNPRYSIKYESKMVKSGRLNNNYNNKEDKKINPILPTICEVSYTLNSAPHLISKENLLWNIVTEKLNFKDMNNFLSGKHNQSALHVAAKQGNFTLMKELIQLTNPTVINLPDKMGNTALHFAGSGKFGSAAMVDLLVLNGANVNSQNIRGQTALMVHIMTTKVDNTLICEKFLRHCADPNLHCKNGETTFDIAIQNGLNQIAGVLYRAMHKSDIDVISSNAMNLADKNELLPPLRKIPTKPSNKCDHIFCKGCLGVYSRMINSSILRQSQRGIYPLEQNCESCDGFL